MSRWLRVLLLGAALFTILAGCDKAKENSGEPKTMKQGRMPPRPTQQ